MRFCLPKSYSVMKLLTIVVPAYNAEQHLKRCLDSLCQEPFVDQLQILVINDGSKDRTSWIAHEYARAFPSSVQVIDKENGGHGSGINAAVPAACGKYFQVIDSDDWVVASNMQKLLLALQQTDADMVLCHYHMVNLTTGKKRAFKTEGIVLNRVYSFAEFMEHPRTAWTCCFFHGILYRTEFYRDTGIRLSEKTFYEDQEYSTLPAYYARTILPLDLFIYQYAVGNAAQSVSDENQVKNMEQIKTVFWKICNFYCAHRDMAAAQRKYFLFKLNMLLQSYCVVALIKDQRRDIGNRAAVAICEKVKVQCPELYQQFKRRYLVLRMLHFLHISSQMFQKIQESRQEGILLFKKNKRRNKAKCKK